MLAVACPRTRCTTLTSAPAAIHTLAAVCRRSWIRSGANPGRPSPAPSPSPAASSTTAAAPPWVNRTAVRPFARRPIARSMTGAARPPPAPSGPGCSSPSRSPAGPRRGTRRRPLHPHPEPGDLDDVGHPQRPPAPTTASPVEAEEQDQVAVPLPHRHRERPHLSTASAFGSCTDRRPRGAPPWPRRSGDPLVRHPVVQDRPRSVANARVAAAGAKP